MCPLGCSIKCIRCLAQGFSGALAMQLLQSYAEAIEMQTGLLCLYCYWQWIRVIYFAHISKGYLIYILTRVWLHHNQWSNSEVKGMDKFRWYKTPKKQTKSESSSSFMGYTLFKGCRSRSRAPSQYPKRRLLVRSRKVSKPRDWYFKLSYRFEIWLLPKCLSNFRAIGQF